jgi:hypothetical protein
MYKVEHDLPRDMLDNELRALAPELDARMKVHYLDAIGLR